MTLIIGLILLGLELISFEVIVPGGVLGILGALSIIGACILSFQEYGLTGATGIFIGSLIVVVVMLALELKFLPKTKLGSRMFLNYAIDDKSTQVQGTDKLIGKEGEIVSDLVPSGKILVEGKYYEAFSKDGLIHSGERVKITDRDNFRIVVKKI